MAGRGGGPLEPRHANAPDLRRSRRLSPHAALRYTMRRAKQGGPRYEAAVRHFIVYFIEEFDPKPLMIRRLADAFECLPGAFLGEEAKLALSRLDEQIRCYEEGLGPAAKAADIPFAGVVERYLM